MTTSCCGVAWRGGTYYFDNAYTRHYSEKKIAENNEAEIMGVVAEDARESYVGEAIVTLQSDTTDEMESNVERIVQWIHVWRQARGFDA